MDLNEVIAHLLTDATLMSAKDADMLVPNTSGLYSIFVDDATSLPSPFGDCLSKRRTNLIYLGKASGSLKERVVEQDLRHKNPSTFFRGIGAVLGYRPPPGSLKGKRNQNNYRFSATATKLIIEWINSHLSVRWSVLSEHDIELFEPKAIASLRPLLNSQHNPEPLPELVALREQCRVIAKS